LGAHHSKPDRRNHAARLAPEVRRAQIVEAAAGVFRGRDPIEVSFEEVAEAAGVSRSLVYTYFGDRGGLIAAVYLHDLDHLDQALSGVLDDRLPADVQLRRVIRRYLRFARDNHRTWALITAAGALQHPEVQAARRGRIERIAATWGKTAEARLMARGVVGLLEAAATDWAQYRECSLDRATELLFALLWKGLGGLRADTPAEAAPLAPG
jgi:AcrR family transcriptional regulator